VADLVCGEGVVRALPLHAHDAMRVIIPSSRLAVVDGRGEVAVLRPGLVHWAAPMELHSVRSVDGVPCALRMLLVSPEPSTIADPGANRGASAPVATIMRSGVLDDRELHARLSASIDALRGPLVPVDCVGPLRASLAVLLARRDDAPALCASPVAPRSAGLARVCAHLRTHVAQNVSLDELAAVARLSKYYLLRAFAREHGVTPHVYQMLLRVARAWRLIGEGLPISRVAYDTGFADQSHLTRRFAELHGVTPGRWARLLAIPPAAVPESSPVAWRTRATLPAA
jgi:AraC-like DNA-binding protein